MSVKSSIERLMTNMNNFLYSEQIKVNRRRD